MDNKFCLLSVRFHQKDKNKLLIQGYFEQNEMQGERPIVSLDYTALSYTVEKYSVVRNPLEYMEERYGDRRYFFWVELPKDYEQYRELRCFQYEGLEVRELFHISVKWLAGLWNRREFFLDEHVYDRDGFRVRGWYIGEAEEQPEALLRKNGKPIADVSIRRVRRPDVERAYPECEPEEVHGFEIRGREARYGRLLLCIGRGGEARYQEIRLKPAGKVESKRKNAERIRKVKVYYQQFGMRRTFARVLEKLGNRETTTYQKWRWKHEPCKKELERQKRERFPLEPVYAVVVPLYRTPKRYLEEMIASVLEQTYPNFILYLSDGSGPGSPLLAQLAAYERSDSRIRVIRNDAPLRIAENTNAALAVAEGDFIVFMDHDDVITPDAFYECTKALNGKPDADIFYSDEDKISMDGKACFQPHFKSDFNLDMLRSANYMCHLFVVRRSLLEKTGYLNPEFEGSQDYDLILRLIERTDRIVHIPKILYHWRAHMDSTAGNPKSKDYAYVAGQRAIAAHYARVGIDAEVTRLSRGFYRSHYRLREYPLISVVIPNKDHIEDLDRCLFSIIGRTKYPRLEFLIVENNSEKEETFAYYRDLEKSYDNVRILYWRLPFNYSAINNFAVKEAKGDYLLLLNNDTEMKNADCLEEMLAVLMREDVGVVGARLFYPDGVIQHAGVIVGLGGIAGHAFLGLSGKDPGYFARVTCMQDYSAVTAACMMVKRKVYEAVDGMDEAFEVAFNDVDFCMRVRRLGQLIVYQPFAMLYHYESKTRGADDTDEKAERFRRETDLFGERWKEFLRKGDPYYNPNLTLQKHDFSLRL